MVESDGEAVMEGWGRLVPVWDGGGRRDSEGWLGKQGGS